ncbi:MAG: hypothetical protein ACKOBL_05080 [Chloroflexota bacterium]
MLILVTCLLLFITALALVVLRATQPNARYAWLIAAGGALLAYISMFLWLPQMPFQLILPAWKPENLFSTPVLFSADGISWALAMGITALTLSVLLTIVTRSVIVNSLSWAGILILGGMGILAVTANNPLTLLLMWAFLDITELVTQLSSVDGEKNSERVVISFSTRVLGIALLLWSYIEGFSRGSTVVFQNMHSNTGIYLIIAAGLRLGVLPLHLPYAADSSLRRGFGTALRLIGAASTLSVLGHVQITSTLFTPVLMVLTSVAAIYGGWMWLRAPDELSGRPYWMIGIASLAVIAALSGNPTGATAWGCALVLVGGALFLSSVQDVRLNRVLLIGSWSLSALPLSLTASTWAGGFTIASPFSLAAQVLIMAGYVRHALRASGTESLDGQPGWAKVVYPTGILLLLITQILLGFIGWDGALKFGNFFLALLASLLTLGLLEGTRRFRIFNPIRAQWITTAGAGVNSLYQGLWTLYRGLARLAQSITDALEGDGGIMWTLLFLILFISMIVQGVQ